VAGLEPKELIIWGGDNRATVPAENYGDPRGYQGFVIDKEDNGFAARMEQYNAEVWADGNMTSTLDFSGATLFVVDYGSDLNGLIPESIYVDNKDGQKVCATGPFREVEAHSPGGEKETVFRYEFPKS